MKFFVFLSFFGSLTLFAAPNTNLKPVWEDNFDAKEIDPKKWATGGQVRIVDGKLSLEIAPGEKPTFWRSSWASSGGKFSYGQGYFEASIRMIQTKGRWVNFSIQNDDKAKLPRANLSFTCTGADRIETNLWFTDETGSHRLVPQSPTVELGSGASFKKFNIYGLQWNDKRYYWYVNGRKVHEMARPIPSAPMYLRFSHDLPEGGYLKEFSNPSLGPEPMQVDWVKVFKIP